MEENLSILTEKQKIAYLACCKTETQERFAQGIFGKQKTSVLYGLRFP